MDRRIARTQVSKLALFALALSSPSSVFAHATPEERLAALERRAEPTCDARQSITRARLLADGGDPAAALAELDRAERCDAPAELELARAGLYLQAGDAAAAREAADRYLSRQPDDQGRGWLLRARAQRALGEWAPAVEDFNQALARLNSPQPDHYLERARAQLHLGRADDAARDLNIAIRRIGPAPALVTLAVDLDCAAGRQQEALRTLEQLSPVQRESTPWLLRRAEILAAVGRIEEARELCRRTQERRPRQLSITDPTQRCAGLQENP